MEKCRSFFDDTFIYAINTIGLHAKVNTFGTRDLKDLYNALLRVDSKLFISLLFKCRDSKEYIRIGIAIVCSRCTTTDRSKVRPIFE